MKVIGIAAALALGSTLALAQTTGQGTGQGTISSQRQATPSAANAQNSAYTRDYWKQHSKGGYMTRDDVMGYRGADGQPMTSRDGRSMQFSDMDTNGDGRISESEWMSYQGVTSGAPGTRGSTDGTNTGVGTPGSSSSGTR